MYNSGPGKQQMHSNCMQDMTLVDKTSVYISTDEALQAFNAGELGMLASSCANLAGIEESASFEIGTAPFPVFEGEKRAVPAGGCVLAVTSQDEPKKKRLPNSLNFCTKMTTS